MYLHEERYYLISNYAVARNSIFCDIGTQVHFRKKMKFYLEPISEILAFNFKDHEFQILVKLKKREDFENYFERKNEGNPGFLECPQSTYIFSRAMSNLQVSLVKKFNRKYSRRGTLMAGRFQRELITCKQRVIDIIQALNGSKQSAKYSGIWADCSMERIKGMTSRKFYAHLELEYEGGSDGFWKDIRNNLVGNFTVSKIKDSYYPISFHHRQLFKSICKYIE